MARGTAPNRSSQIRILLSHDDAMRWGVRRFHFTCVILAFHEQSDCAGRVTCEEMRRSQTRIHVSTLQLAITSGCIGDQFKSVIARECLLSYRPVQIPNHELLVRSTCHPIRSCGMRVPLDIGDFPRRTIGKEPRRCIQVIEVQYIQPRFGTENDFLV